jgi:hypothetical protein
MDIRHQHRLISLEGVAGLGARARFDDGLSDQVLKPRQSGPHGQHVYLVGEFKHLAVLDLQDSGCGTDRFVEKIVESRSGQSVLSQPRHRFLFESPYPQILLRVPALGDVHPHRLSAPSRDGEILRYVVPGYGARLTVFAGQIALQRRQECSSQCFRQRRNQSVNLIQHFLTLYEDD